MSLTYILYHLKIQWHYNLSDPTSIHTHAYTHAHNLRTRCVWRNRLLCKGVKHVSCESIPQRKRCALSDFYLQSQNIILGTNAAAWQSDMFHNQTLLSHTIAAAWTMLSSCAASWLNWGWELIFSLWENGKSLCQSLMKYGNFTERPKKGKREEARLEDGGREKGERMGVDVKR